MTVMAEDLDRKGLCCLFAPGGPVLVTAVNTKPGFVEAASFHGVTTVTTAGFRLSLKAALGRAAHWCGHHTERRGQPRAVVRGKCSGNEEVIGVWGIYSLCF